MEAIVVGTDGSDRGLAALLWAADEARRRCLRLRIVHTVPWLYGTPIVPTSGVVPDEAVAAGREVLDKAMAAVSERDSGVRVECELMIGSAARVLLERGDAAGMVVVGAHGVGLSAWLGSTASQVVTHTRVPAVVVRHVEPASSGEIVLGVDRAPAEEPAIRFAFEEAIVRGARLRVVHAWSHPGSGGPGDMRPLVYEPEEITEDEARSLSETLSRWREKFPGVDVVSEVIHGRPSRVLSGASARADLLVVGSRGRGGFTGLLLGSVSHALLHDAHCPMAVVPSARGERNEDHEQL